MAPGTAKDRTVVPNCAASIDPVVAFYHSNSMVSDDRLEVDDSYSRAPGFRNFVVDRKAWFDPDTNHPTCSNPLFLLLHLLLRDQMVLVTSFDSSQVSVLASVDDTSFDPHNLEGH